MTGPFQVLTGKSHDRNHLARKSEYDFLENLARREALTEIAGLAEGEVP